MDIIVSGTIVLALQPQSGVSARGNQWARQSYVIEHESGQYPKRLVFDVKDAKIQELSLQIGEQVTVHLNADAHEWPENSGKWFNNLSAWKVDRQYQQQGYQQPMAGGYQQMPQQGYQQPMQQQAPFPQQGQQMQQPVPGQAPFPPQQAPVQQPVQGQQLPFPPAQ